MPLPAGLRIESLGTAGYRITYDGHTLLVDPYLTRIPLSAVLRRAPAYANTALHEPLLDTDIGEVEAILVGHTHFDHAIDVPVLARTLDTRAFGSDSLLRLMRLYGREDRAVEVVAHRRYELGPFVVEFVPSLHSKLLLGYKVPFDGRSFTERYWDRVLRRLQPAVVVASHFDDFFRPLAAPIGFSTNVNLSALPDEIHAVSRDITVAAFAPLTVTAG